MIKVSGLILSKIAAACSPLAVPILAELLLPESLSDWTFTPRGIVYSDQFAPIFLAPFAKPETILVGVSRLIQCGVLFCLGLEAMGMCWGAWVILALIRSGTGHLLTRSVGWAAPVLFSHWALYETASGFGPALVVYLVVNGPGTLYAYAPDIIGGIPQHFALPLLTATWCWLECRPWTFGTALAVTPFILLLQRLLSKTTTLPTPATEKDIPRRHRLYQITLSGLAILIPWLVVYHLLPPHRLPLPLTEAPLLDILVLSFPRPVPLETSVAIINTTVQSFLPYLSPAVALSLFTHSTNHEALSIVHQQSPGVSLHIDDDTHPEDQDGHYLHLAEAFRRMLEGSETKGEWIMLVEDDFPVCHGDAGWSVISTVVNMLETDRRAGNTRSGFIGTGGR